MLFIPIGCPVILYNNKDLSKEILIVDKECYWYGNGKVGYKADNGINILTDINKTNRITHVVPNDRNYINPNYGTFYKDKYGYKRVDTNYFLNDYTWEDFRKENIQLNTNNKIIEYEKDCNS